MPVAVHPRVCGEQEIPRSRCVSVYGSSPRVRGTVTAGPTHPARRRFIPACAGNSRYEYGVLGPTPVHPRVCGEQPNSTAITSAPFGSSPRVRRTAQGGKKQSKIGRFIPACAGNRSTARTTSIRTAVHPRVCGEQSHFVTQRPVIPGSSPRVRGTVRRFVFCGTTNRFIPACAGNSDERFRRDPPGSVHPRVCGEQGPEPRFDYVFDGSSPRVRGTVSLMKQPGWFWRFIPACAGNRPVPGH